MSAQEEDQVPVVDDEQVEAEEQTSASDEKETLGSEGQQLDQEANDLDESNIIDDKSGPAGKSLRGNRGDPMAAVSHLFHFSPSSFINAPRYSRFPFVIQDKEIDQAVDAEE